MRKFKGYKMDIIHKESKESVITYTKDGDKSETPLHPGDFLIIMRKPYKHKEKRHQF